MHGAEGLHAIYVLQPPSAATAGAPALSVSPLGAAEAFASVVRHSTVAPLLDKTRLPALLERASAIVRTVPVFSLRLVRDLARLPDAVGWILEEHAAVEATC
jgi:hypothetical protein